MKRTLCDSPKPGSLPAGCKPYSQLNYFRQIIRAYQGRDEDAVKYVKKVKALIDKPLDKIKSGHGRLAMAKVKCPRKLDVSVFYQLTRRLPHEDGVLPQCDPGPDRWAHLIMMMKNY